MTVVHNIARDSAGQPLDRARVRIVLATGTRNLPGYTADGDIVGPGSVRADENGNWSCDLAPNSEIEPANTYYLVTEGGTEVTPIVVPATGGPYLLRDVRSTPPPTPSAPGMTGLRVLVDSTAAGTRAALNLIAGANTTIAAEDNPAEGAVDVTITAAGGGGGAGTVVSVNDQTPDQAGNVTLAAADVGAIPVSATGIPDGVASLDADGHLTAAQAALLLAAADNLAALPDKATARTNLGLGSAATQPASAFDAAGAAAAALSAAEGNAADTYVPKTTPVALADGATIATDASQGGLFRVTLGGDRTLSNPTNAVDGQLITWSIKQDATGARTLALDSKFRFGTDITSITLTTTPGKTDHLGARYNAQDDRFDVIAFARGF